MWKFSEDALKKVSFGSFQVWKANREKREWSLSKPICLLRASNGRWAIRGGKKLLHAAETATVLDIFGAVRGGLCCKWKPHQSNIYTCCCGKEQAIKKSHGDSNIYEFLFAFEVKGIKIKSGDRMISEGAEGNNDFLRFHIAVIITESISIGRSEIVEVLFGVNYGRCLNGTHCCVPLHRMGSSRQIKWVRWKSGAPGRFAAPASLIHGGEHQRLRWRLCVDTGLWST